VCLLLSVVNVYYIYVITLQMYKIFFGFGRRESLTNTLVSLGLPSFDTLMANATVSYARLCTSCTNRIVMHLRQLSLFSFV